MSGVNKVILLGRMGKDPEIRYTQAGDAVANFSLATSDVWKDRNTHEKIEKTEWHRCVAWKRRAELIGEYLRKGSRVYIEGSLQTRQWEDRDGNKRYTTEIKVKHLEFIDWPDDGGRKHSEWDHPYSADGAHKPTDQQVPDPEDDDIPF